MSTFNITPDECLKRLGIFKALQASAIQFNSIIFRVVIGVILNVPLDTVALVSTIEYFLNTILEVPLGQAADKYGRIPSALTGHVFIVLAGVGYYLAISGLFSEAEARFVFYFSGICIGVGKPLISGSVEAFYQSALERYSEETKHKEKIENSFLLSQSFGIYVMFFSIILAFSILYIFYYLEIVEQVFLIGISLFASLNIVLYFDCKRLGDPTVKKKQVSLKIFDVLKKLNNYKSKQALFLHLSSELMNVVIAGYMLISIGREFKNEDKIVYWSLMISLYMGIWAVGYIVKGRVLPHIRSRLTRNNFLNILYLIIVSINIIMLVVNSYPKPDYFLLGTLIFLYGVISRVCFSGIFSESINLLLINIPKSYYATALSIQSIPSYLGIALYGYIVMVFQSGAPTFTQVFSTVLYVAIVSLITKLFFFNKVDKK